MNLYKFYKNAFSITFIIEIFCTFFLIIYLIFFGIFGGTSLIGTELNILLILITLGISCVITLVAIAVFMRGRDKLLQFIGSEKDFPSETLAERIILAIWIAAIFFFSTAVFYGFALIYQHQIFEVYGQVSGILFVFIILGIVVICLILQFFLIIMSKMTKRVVREVLND